METQRISDTAIRSKLFAVLAGSVIVTSFLILFPPSENYLTFRDLTINVSAGIALGFALTIVCRQKLDGLHGKTYAALFVGLALWFAAEILWTYYELGVGIERPFPSLADSLWLAGYGFFAYYLIKTYRFFRKIFSRYIVIISTAGAAIFLTGIIYLSVSLTELSTQEDLVLLLVSLAYPALDMLLIVPSLIILSGLRHGKLTAPSWMLVSISLLITAGADTGFAYSSLVSYTEIDWIWDVLYNASYLCMAAALFWYNRFFIFDKGKAVMEWKKENR